MTYDTDGMQEVPFELAEQVLAAQPFSRHLEVGLHSFEPGSASLWLRVRPFHLQQQGRVHGGVLAYLVDNAVTFAAGSRLGPDVVTTSVDVQYVAAARGPILVARAHVEHVARRTAFCAVRVVQTGTTEGGTPDDTEELVSVGHGQVRQLGPTGSTSQ